MLCQSEKWGARPITLHRIDLFNHVINTCNLIDLGFDGVKFTWKNKRGRMILFLIGLTMGWGMGLGGKFLEFLYLAFGSHFL